MEFAQQRYRADELRATHARLGHGRDCLWIWEVQVVDGGRCLAHGKAANEKEAMLAGELAKLSFTEF